MDPTPSPAPQKKKEGWLGVGFTAVLCGIFLFWWYQPTRVDTTTRAIEVRAEFPNPDGALKPGMFLTVKLALNRRENALIVPEESVVPEGIRQYVYIVTDGKAVKTEVKLGARLPGEVEIREGLQPGSVIVTSGIQKIRDGSPVRTGA